MNSIILGEFLYESIFLNLNFIKFVLCKLVFVIYVLSVDILMKIIGPYVDQVVMGTLISSQWRIQLLPLLNIPPLLRRTILKDKYKPVLSLAIVKLVA